MNRWFRLAPVVSLAGLGLASAVCSVGSVGCNNLTKPDDITVAPGPRQPASAAPAGSAAPRAPTAPPPSGH